LEKELRKKLIKQFSSHCKKTGWGKVYATQVLSEYLYPESNKDGISSLRIRFVDKWVEVIDAVIYKSSTTLSKPEFLELVDAIQSYLLSIDNENNETLLDHSFVDHLSKAFQVLNSSHHPQIIEENILERTFKISNSQDTSMLVLRKLKDKCYHCFCVVKNKRHARPRVRNKHKNNPKHPINYLEEDLNLSYLKGVLYSNSESELSLDGLLVDDLERVVFSIKITTPEYVVPSRLLDAIQLERIKNDPVVRIETSTPFFTTRFSPQIIKSDSVVLGGPLIECQKKIAPITNKKAQTSDSIIKKELVIFSEMLYGK